MVSILHQCTYTCTIEKMHGKTCTTRFKSGMILVLDNEDAIELVRQRHEYEDWKMRKASVVLDGKEIASVEVGKNVHTCETPGAVVPDTLESWATRYIPANTTYSLIYDKD
jgi:hypothetical protein